MAEINQALNKDNSYTKVYGTNTTDTIQGEYDVELSGAGSGGGTVTVTVTANGASIPVTYLSVDATNTSVVMGRFRVSPGDEIDVAITGSAEVVARFLSPVRSA